MWRIVRRWRDATWSSTLTYCWELSLLVEGWILSTVCSTVLVAIKGVNGLTVSIKLAVDVYSSTMLTAWVVILLPLSSKILMQTKKECGRWLWLRQGTWIFRPGVPVGIFVFCTKYLSIINVRNLAPTAVAAAVLQINQFESRFEIYILDFCSS